MKTLLYSILLLFLLLGCTRSNVYHTFYGDICIDTMEVSFIKDEIEWYKVREVEKDSFCWDGEWQYLHGPIINYYSPQNNKYLEEFPDNQGRRIVIEIDPYHMYDWLNN